MSQFRLLKDIYIIIPSKNFIRIKIICKSCILLFIMFCLIEHDNDVTIMMSFYFPMAKRVA